MSRTPVFVFGSNRRGVHGAGSALEARRHWGAIYGVGEGIQGHAYAIPTKDKFLKILPLSEIEKHVATFLAYAREHTDCQFNVVEIGCGLAGYTPAQIAPFFKGYSSNVCLPYTFMQILSTL